MSIRFGVVMLLCVSMSAQEKPAAISKLHVKRVVLFKNGVGYFEHVGSVHGNESVTVSFTSGQLIDVLKSLTVLALKGGRIAGVPYGTSAPVNRQLGDLRLPVGDDATLAEVLGALRGNRIEIKSGTSVLSGRLLSVEKKTRIIVNATVEVDYLSLKTDNGELRTTELPSSFTVRSLEPGLAGRLDRYLNLVSAEREADVRNMVILTEGTGDRSLYVSYTSEVPVWKSTYRLVLNSKAEKGPLLQGWAIVDNVGGEDWNNVGDGCSAVVYSESFAALLCTASDDCFAGYGFHRAADLLSDFDDGVGTVERCCEGCLRRGDFGCDGQRFWMQAIL